jgi:hypothetical protein
MGLVEAGVWGVIGGLAAGLLAVSAEVTATGFKWPWKLGQGGLWPRMFVAAVGVVLGGVVATAARSQMTGAWPAFLLGIGAPSVVRRALSGVEVAEKDDPVEGGGVSDAARPA